MHLFHRPVPVKKLTLTQHLWTQTPRNKVINKSPSLKVFLSTCCRLQSICTSLLGTNEPKLSSNLKYSRCILAVNSESNGSLIRCRRWILSIWDELPGHYPPETDLGNVKEVKTTAFYQPAHLLLHLRVCLPTNTHLLLCVFRETWNWSLMEWVSGWTLLRKKRQPSLTPLPNSLCDLHALRKVRYLGLSFIPLS